MQTVYVTESKVSYKFKNIKSFSIHDEKIQVALDRLNQTPFSCAVNKVQFIDF